MKISLRLVFTMVAGIAAYQQTSHAQTISGTMVGRYATGLFDAGSTEIVAYDPQSKQLFSVNAVSGDIDIISITNPAQPQFISSIDLAPYGKSANSVAFKDGVLAAAVEASNKQELGKVVFFDAQGNFLNSVNSGALPDMLTFSPDGLTVLVANEGEPSADYTVDPVGSITIISLDNGVLYPEVTVVGFESFIGKEDSLRTAGIRIFGPNANAAQDIEPEYIAVSADSKTAWVVCQENNAMAKIDLTTKSLIGFKSLGLKDHNVISNAFDPSDRNDGKINIKPYPAKGMYMPDGMAAITIANQTYILTANEGDAREYGDFVENARLKDLSIDAALLAANPGLAADSALGRLNISKLDGDIDNDGDIDVIHSYGARSFSVFSSDINLLYDSGNEFETFFATETPNHFNTSHTNNTKKNRSDDKGPEPECITVLEAGPSKFAFIGLERTSGILVYDVTQPTQPVRCGYITSRDFTQTPGANTQGGDLGPEGLITISGSDSPDGMTYLVSANEVSGSIAIYRLSGSGLSSLTENQKSHFDAVWPNPVTGEVLYLTRETSGKILDINGRVLQTVVNSKQINVSQLQPGMYLLENDLGITQRFIKQ